MRIVWTVVVSAIFGFVVSKIGEYFVSTSLNFCCSPLAFVTCFVRSSIIDEMDGSKSVFELLLDDEELFIDRVIEDRVEDGFSCVT